MEESEEEESRWRFPLFSYRACEDDVEDGCGDYTPPLALFCGARESGFGEASIRSLWTDTVTMTMIYSPLQNQQII